MPDAQSVDPDLDVITMAVKVPETLAHLHYWSVQLTRPASKEEVLDAFAAPSRIALIRMDAGLTALNAVKELMADLGRPHDNLYEVALWSDGLVAYLCRPNCSFRPPSVRKPRDFSRQGLSGGGVGYRSR